MFSSLSLYTVAGSVDNLLGDEGDEEGGEEEVEEAGPPQIDPATGQVVPRKRKKKRRIGRRKLLENLSTKPTDFQVNCFKAFNEYSCLSNNDHKTLKGLKQSGLCP